MVLSQKFIRQLVTSIVAMALFTVVLGVVYPLAVAAVGQFAFRSQANGSIVTDASGTPVGSSLIGQSFTTADGTADARYFQSRPSVAGDGYDAMASSGSNLGPTSEELATLIAQRRAAIAALDGVSAESIPNDAVTASGSGLDPDISVAYAEVQINRVATARGVSASSVRDLVASMVEARPLGFLGDETVNVLALNRALDRAAR